MPKSRTAKPSVKSANKKQAAQKKPGRLARLRARMSTGYLGRSHSSFRLTRRRDYVRTMTIAGYTALTAKTIGAVWRSKALFLRFIALHVLLSILFLSLASQDMYRNFSDVVASAESGVGAVWQAVLIAGTGITGGLSSAETDPTAGVYGVILFLFGWLTILWLLRAIMAGKKPLLRDGMYSAGAPAIPTLMLLLVLIVQLLPAALALIGYQAAQTSGLLTMGVEAMLFWFVAALLASLTLYWMPTTLLSLVVASLPGMYPLTAHKNAYLLVNGRRLHFILRLLWLVLVLAVIWFVTLVPMILLEQWLSGLVPVIGLIPIIPFLFLLLGSLSLLFATTYVYLLYREVVDHDAR